LILIDEWIAYARQLHDQGDLPAGTFETHFTFAQVLTESAKLAQQCLLVISLPASESDGSPHTQAHDVEVGGERGRMALDRLRNAIGRVEASWRPASAEASGSSLLVWPEPALKQREAETPASPGSAGAGAVSTFGNSAAGSAPAGGPSSEVTGIQPAFPPKLKRFHGSVPLDPTRVGRDASRLADEVLAHLVGLVGSTVKVTLEIEAEIPSGAPDNVVRTVTENSRTLKFTNQGFEAEER